MMTPCETTANKEDCTLNGRTLNDDLEVVLLKPRFVVVADYS